MRTTTHMTHCVLACTIIALGPWPAAHAGSPPQYHVTELTPDPQDFSTAWAIDEDSNIAGEGAPCIALWSKVGSAWELSSAAPGCDFPWMIIPTAISDGGITGWGSCCANQAIPFLVQKGELIQIPAGEQAAATDVNSLGQVVGNIGFSTGFIYENGIVTPLPNGAAANAITDEGVIVGKFGDEAALWHLVDGKWTPQPLGIEAELSEAVAMNAQGQVVGNYRLAWNEPWLPFLWENEKITELGSLGDWYANATDITPDGMVIGSFDVIGSGTFPFIWLDGVMYDLNDLTDSPLGLTYAMDANSRGQIVGWSNETIGPSHAYVATPIIEGDLTLDARVNAADLAELLASWGPCAQCAADFDGDGIVGPADLAVLLAGWTL